MATTRRDYYEVLGTSRNATEDDIRKAFRKKAFEYHPDRNKETSAEAKFKECNEAYEVLRDPEKRARYDRFGHAGAASAGAGFDGFSDFPGFGDIFDAFFGGARSQSRPGAARRGADLSYTATIEFEEAAFGCEKQFEVSRMERCSRCSGQRSEPGTQPETCGTCNGVGQVRQTQRSVFGQFVNVTTCPHCRGEGKIIAKPCTQCRGEGRQRIRKTVAVNIPAGVNDGMQLRVNGEGEAGLGGGPRGDFYVAIHVQDHAVFDREQDDILYTLPINVTQAILGDDVEIPVLGSTTTVKIPAGAQPGTVLRLRGKGIAHLRGGGRGDQLVTIDVVIPKHLDSKQKKAFEELDKTLKKPDPNKREKSFFDRMREVLG